MNVRIKMIIFHFAIMAIIAIIIILIVATFLKVKNTTFVILLILSILFLGSSTYQFKVQNETRKLFKKYCTDDKIIEKHMHFYTHVFLNGQLVLGIILFVGALIALLYYPQGLRAFFVSNNLVGLFTIFIGIFLYLAADKIIEKSSDILKKPFIIRGFKISCWLIVLMGMIFIIVL